MTLTTLNLRHPRLFCQLVRLFGRQRAGHVVLDVHRRAKEDD
jgi:hypothetical protein